VLCFSAAHLLGANEFVAAFAAGATIASRSGRIRRAYQPFGEPFGELLKLAGVFLFGAVVSPGVIAAMTPAAWGFCLLTVLVVRPAVFAVVLLRSGLDRRERRVAAWFGPRGFASIVYGLMVLRSGLGEQQQVFAIVAMVILTSIVLHSSTDVPAAQFFRRAAS